MTVTVSCGVSVVTSSVRTDVFVPARAAALEGTSDRDSGEEKNRPDEEPDEPDQGPAAGAPAPGTARSRRARAHAPQE